MSKDNLNQPMPEPSQSASSIAEKIAALRHRLTTDAAAWPEPADALFTDLASSSEEMEDDAMLTLLVQDALYGVDLSRKYPQAYRHLLSNGRSRQLFLDLLTALETRSATMPPLPKADLSFLQTAVSPQPTIHHTPSGWRAAWRLVGSYLTNCFPTSPTLVYRSTYDDLLEDQDIILLDDEFTIADMRLNILLEANLTVTSPDAPTLSLIVAAYSGSQPPILQATLQWGSYEATAVLDAYGQAFLPPLAFNQVLDNEQQTINADLQLILELIT